MNIHWRGLLLTLFFPLLLIFSSGCYQLPIYRDEPPAISDPHDLQLQYLGSGGFLIRHGGGAFLSAPLFSNPSILDILLGRLHQNAEAINRHMPPAADVAAIFSGHSHYDHLMDVSYIARKYAPEAVVYGNRTMTNLISSDLGRERQVILNKRESTADSMGGWIEVAIPDSTVDTRLRFIPIRSEHAPHFKIASLKITLYSGFQDTLLPSLPGSASAWKSGETFAFLFDFLDREGKVTFRIYYQDSPANFPLSFPPLIYLYDKRRVDVAILCLPTHDNVSMHPERIISWLNPRHIVLAHWENFFNPWTDDPENLSKVPLSNPKDFIKRMLRVIPSDADWYLPRPGGRIIINQPDKDSAGVDSD